MITNITKENFDEWLFNYFEGELSASDKEKFMRFIAQNPAYKEDFNLWNKATVSAENVVVPVGIEKDFLRKESFWKSGKGKTIIAVSFAVAIGGVIALSTKDEEPMPPTAATAQPTIEVEKNSIPKIEEAPVENTIQQEAKTPVFTSEEKTNTPLKGVLPTAQKNEVKTEPVITVTEEVKATKENVNASTSSVQQQTTTNAETQTLKKEQTPEKKKDGFEKKRKDPKNIITPHTDTW